MGTEGTAPSGYNYFSHTLDKTDPNNNALKITLNETTINGFYSLTKTMDDNEIVKNITGLYTFELRNTTDNTLIATGVSQKDGRVLWTYKLPGLYLADNPQIILTGTTTYKLELAVYNKDKAKITYEVREYIPKTVYGDTSIEYSYTTPSGWTLSSDGKYFTKKITLNDNDTFVDTIKNNVEYADVTITKAIPKDDTFDRTKVTFYLYNTDKNILIATGSVDSKGNIEWTKSASKGYGVDDYKVGINEVTHLPLGNYRVEEVWDRAYLNSLSGEQVEIISTNNSGWELDQRPTTTRYFKSFKLTKDGQKLAFGAIENDEHVQWFNMVKKVTVAGDIGTVKAVLYYEADDGKLIRVAEGTCETSKGIGTYNFPWKYIRSLKKAIGKLKVWIQDVATAIKEVDLEPKQINLSDLLFARFDERGKDVGVTDFLSFGKVMKYLREYEIKTVPELDDRLSFLSVTAQPIKEQISDISGEIKKVEKLVSHIDTKAKLDPVHDKYTKIRWKGRKEKFAAEHKDELTEWKKSKNYIDQHMSAGTYTKEELKARISSLKTKLKDLNEQLKPYQAETEIIKYTRSIVKKLIPELTPEGAKLTPEIKKEKRSMLERLAAAKQIVKENKKHTQPKKNRGISR